MFRLSLFFDFYVYLMLGIGLAFFWIARRKKGEETYANMFVKGDYGDNKLPDIIEIKDTADTDRELVIKVHGGMDDHRE